MALDVVIGLMEFEADPLCFDSCPRSHQTVLQSLLLREKKEQKRMHLSLRTWRVKMKKLKKGTTKVP